MASSTSQRQPAFVEKALLPVLQETLPTCCIAVVAAADDCAAEASQTFDPSRPALRLSSGMQASAHAVVGMQGCKEDLLIDGQGERVADEVAHCCLTHALVNRRREALEAQQLCDAETAAVSQRPVVARAAS